eukprot:2492443-Karenia_brevis.AAC.2
MDKPAEQVMQEHRFNTLLAPLPKKAGPPSKREPPSEIEELRNEVKRLKAAQASGGGKQGKSAKSGGKGSKGRKNRGKGNGKPDELKNITPFGGRKYCYAFNTTGCNSSGCSRGEHACIRCGGNHSQRSPTCPAR